MKTKKKSSVVTEQEHQDKVLDVISYCEQQAIKLTPLRKKVLLIVTNTKQPLTAYQVLDELRKENPKAQVMSVYRVLDYLIKHHLIHRIENLNAFMPCCHLAMQHLSQWLICEICGDTQEFTSPIFNQGVIVVEKQTGFSVTTSTIELLGLCQSCQNTDKTEVT